MIILGLDIGSRHAKAAILDRYELRHAMTVDVVAATPEEIAELVTRAVAGAGLTRRDLALIVATGASAEQSRDAELLADEATCVAAAVAYFAPDARMAGKAIVLAAAVPTRTPVVYCLAITRQSTHPSAARNFADHIRSPAGRKILAGFGFQKIKP